MAHNHQNHCGCGCHEEHHHEENHCSCGCHEEHHHEEDHCGCGCHEEHHHEENHCGCGCHHHEGGIKKDIIIICIATLLWIGLQFLPADGVFQQDGLLRLGLFLVVYLIIGYEVLKEAVEGILHGEVFDENFLMAIATIGAFALAVYDGSGDYNEGIAVMFFFKIGELFETYAVSRSRKSITELMDIRPDYANVEMNGVVERRDPSDVAVGSVIVCKPGEKIPLDGVVVEGVSMVNTSALTGESVPRDVTIGGQVLSGCINESGVLKICTTKEYGESTVAHILELVENSANNKSNSETFISRFARVYTPIVCYAALLLAILPPLCVIGWNYIHEGAFLFDADTYTTWIYRALTFLVISCPCALVISIPLTFFAGIGGASRHGILVKGSNYLEMLSKIKTVAFDKTGTLTKGVFNVVDVILSEDSKLDKNQLLMYVAHAESSSTHPIARSICEAYTDKIDEEAISDIQEVSGHGVNALVSGHKVAVGNERLMKVATNDLSWNSRLTVSGTVVFVAIDGRYEGAIILGDEIKPQSTGAIESLHKEGIDNVVLLTGDVSEVANAVAKTLGVDEVHSELLPEHKVKEVESLGSSVAFVGDGINDAPVLIRADVGIAMGGLGSDAAIEAADVVIMDDNPQKVSDAIVLSRKYMRIVWQNICFAIGVKLLCLLAGALGYADMWLAVFADVGVMVLCVLNAIRAIFLKVR